MRRLPRGLGIHSNLTRMHGQYFYVYIMTNRSKTLYTGFTGDLERRVWQHKNHVYEGFTDRYRCDRLMYFERYTTPQAGINREKQIKGWKRIRKIALIVAKNPAWRDLSEEWGKPAKLTWRTPTAQVLRFAQDDAIEADLRALRRLVRRASRILPFSHSAC